MLLKVSTRISSFFSRLVVPSIAAHARATSRYGVGLPSGQGTACTAASVSSCGTYIVYSSEALEADCLERMKKTISTIQLHMGSSRLFRICQKVHKEELSTRPPIEHHNYNTCK